MTRGSIDCPTTDENFEQQGRSAHCKHIRRYHVGERVTLSREEFVRLARLGAVAAVR